MKTRLFPKLPAIVIISIFFLLLVQLYYFNKSLALQKSEFNNAINQYLEKTLLEERKWRTDSIARSMHRWLLDTTITKIYSKPHPISGKTIYYVEDKSAPEIQRTDFSLSFENRPIKDENDPMIDTIALHVVGLFKQGYLNYQSVFYYSSNIGDSAVKLSDKLRSDSSIFRHLYQQELLSHDIRAPFSLKYVLLKDSVLVDQIKDKSANPVAIQTKLFKSDMFDKSEPKYIYAIFDRPFSSIIRSMTGPILVSVLILSLIGGLLLFFYKTVRKQKQLAELKNDFIDNMTHELKTPISIISAAAEALQDFGVNRDQDKTEKYFNNIRGQAKQLDTIVSKVLAISSFEKDILKLSKSEFSLNELFEEIEVGFNLCSEKDRFSFSKPNIDVILLGDRFHLKNVFFNIVDNAVKYNDKPTIEVNADCKTDGKHHTITIKDNGRGINEEHLAHVFSKFYRVPTGNIQKARGYGLGLFYVKKIVDAHGGSVEINSVPGQQTCIVMTLPNSKIDFEKTPNHIN